MNPPKWNRITIPPCICRLLARVNENGRDRFMTDGELMERTKWGKGHLLSVYRSASWEKITVGDMNLFLWACGLQPSQQRRYRFQIERAWLKGGIDGVRRMRHLRMQNGSLPNGSLANSVASMFRMTEMVLEALEHEQQ